MANWQGSLKIAYFFAEKLAAGRSGERTQPVLFENCQKIRILDSPAVAVTYLGNLGVASPFKFPAILADNFYHWATPPFFQNLSSCHLDLPVLEGSIFRRLSGPFLVPGMAGKSEWGKGTGLSLIIYKLILCQLTWAPVTKNHFRITGGNY